MEEEELELMSEDEKDKEKDTSDEDSHPEANGSPASETDEANMHEKSKKKCKSNLKASTPEEKQFGCEICKKTFTRKAVMKRHVLIHLDHREKPFKCEIDNCQKTFTEAYYLERHKLIQCHICQKKYVAL